MATNLLKSVVKATGCNPDVDEDRQEYLTRLVKAVNDDNWDKITAESQDWVNDQVKALKAEEPVNDPEAEEEEAEEEDAEEEEADEEEEAEEEDEDEEDDAKPAKGKKAKPAKAKPAKTKPAKAKPAKAKSKEAEPAKTKPAKAKSKEAEPAKTKPEKVKRSGTADKFRRAFLKAYMKGKNPSSQDVVESLGLNLSTGYAALQANEIRKTVGVLREMELLEAE